MLLFILGCCSRGEYSPIDDGLPSHHINNLDVEYIDIKCGYSYNLVKKIIFNVIAICMLGVPYLAIHWSVKLKLYLLMTPSPLSTSDVVLVNVSIQNKHYFI